MKYIQTSSSLKEAQAFIAQSPWASIDTEADSLHRYRESLCLLQVSVPSCDFVFDALAGLDLHPLAALLSNKPLILHGADFDIRILKKSYRFSPSRIFDTMIAAQLLGHEKQGLADLAERYCSVHLPKTNQKADWSIRPLAPLLLEYAANDTHYLKSIQEAMEKELAALGRSDWVEQSCDKLLRVIANAKEDLEEKAPPWQIKGSKNLSPQALTVLKALWQWREAQAERLDRPRFKVLQSEILLGLAQWAQEDKHTHHALDVASWAKAPRNVRGHYREALNAVLEKSFSEPLVQWSSRGKQESSWKPRPKFKEKILLLKKERDRLSGELKIQPSLLATNAALETLLAKSPGNIRELESLDCLLPWQQRLVAESFLKILNG